MLHFSCDICGKEMLPDNSRRYIVKMEVYAAHDPSLLAEEDLDLDHLEAISEILADEAAMAEEIAPTQRKFRYDLCPSCHKKFIADPLNRDTLHKFDFSSN